jgi:hypothetical protein
MRRGLAGQITNPARWFDELSMSDRAPRAVMADLYLLRTPGMAGSSD